MAADAAGEKRHCAHVGKGGVVAGASAVEGASEQRALELPPANHPPTQLAGNSSQANQPNHEGL